MTQTFYYVNEKCIVLAFHPCITLSDWLRKKVNNDVNKKVRKSDILINFYLKNGKTELYDNIWQ